MPDTEQVNRNLGKASPDPTILTTQQLWREVGSLRELVDAKLGTIITRLDAMDKAVALIQAKADKVPTETDIAVGRLRELTEEKFKGIDTRFSDRDARRSQSTQENKDRVDSAFAASAAANTKSELGFTKQIDSLGQIIATLTTGFDGKINDLKERTSRIESHTKGGADTWGFIISSVAVLVAIASVAIAFAR